MQYNRIMAKTQDTLNLEIALDQLSKVKREYGCEEVTIGFKKSGHGDEIVDYMTMDASSIFRCYELKVTLSDLKTDHKLSFYGNYNYLVVSDTLYEKCPVWDNYIPPYAGIITGTELKIKRPAKKRVISEEAQKMLEDSLLRSIYWKMVHYKDAQDLSAYRNLQKKLTEKEEALVAQERVKEQELWTYHDYEFYFQKNHQESTFSLENAAKVQRKQASLREKGNFTWVLKDGKYVCPVCGNIAVLNSKKEVLLSNYCSFCGADLRKLK